VRLSIEVDEVERRVRKRRLEVEVDCLMEELVEID
jgi:hypothetical protein